ncbi:MAG: protein kinase domain-containing protein [Nitrospirota bacterium]
MIADLVNGLLAFVGAVGSGAPLAVGSVVLGLVLVVVLLRARGNAGASSRRSRSVLQREAKALLAQGAYLDAGRAFQAVGDHDQAIALYTRAGAHRELGQLFEYLKHWDAAAQAYEAAQEPERAATMLLRVGETQRAAELLRRAGKVLAAAELFEKVGQDAVAASLFQSAGHLKRAASLFEKAEQWARSAELFEQDYQQEYRKCQERGVPPAGQAALAAAAQQAGRLWVKAGDPERASAIFRQQGLVADAADALAQSGAEHKAADLYLTQGQYDKAADMFDRLGDPIRRDTALAEAKVQSGDWADAADLFVAVNQPMRAAELYERAGAHKRAAEMHAATGDYKRAADLYLAADCPDDSAKALEQGRRFREAAQLYLKLGKLDRAAALFAQAGDLFESGKIFHQMGRLDEAIETLQRLDSQSQEYYQGSLILGSIFLDRGMLSAVKDRCQKLLALYKDVPEREVEPMYQLARAYEAERDFDSALRLYEKVLAQDFAFRDARERAAQVKAAKAAPSSPPTPQKTSSSSTPRTEARYKILKQIGQGGMGVVYRAEDTVLHRIVAYKVLPTSVKEQRAVLENFLQEARIAASINHPNIVTIYDTGHDPAGEVFISMEFVDGLSLKELLDKMGALPLPQFLSIAKQICAGLGYAHGRRIIHRDIKPSNIMLSRDRMVKIMDFGLAKIVNDAIADRTSVKGTPLYMAPEQILGKEVDHQSDLYSLGCTLYRMATGRLPFTKGDLYYQHLHTVPQHPKELNPKLPSSLNALIMRCLEKDKAKRYQQVGDVLADLDHIKLAA